MMGCVMNSTVNSKMSNIDISVIGRSEAPICVIFIDGMFVFFFFQAEDGIRDVAVTGVQTCVFRSSAFLVPLDAPGVTVGPKYPKMGWRSSDTHPLYFDGVRVPAHHLLGQEGRGYREALAFLTWARIPIAAMSAGLARGCLEATLQFVASRESFGQPLAAHQAVAFGVADLSAMTDTA